MNLYIPPGDVTKGVGPYEPGAVTPYGKALWIPDGYPIACQPFLWYSKVIIRPLRPWWPPNATNGVGYDVYGKAMNVSLGYGYLLAALQAAVTQYGTTQYNVNYAVPGKSSGQRDIEGEILAYVNNNHLLASPRGSDIDWLIPPTFPSDWTDALFNIGKNFTLGVFLDGINVLVPGLGSKLTAYINSLAPGTIGTPSMVSASNVQASSVENAVIQQAQQQQQQGGILSSIASDPILIGIIAAIVILLIIMI